MSKVCYKCRIEKSDAEFYSNSRSKDGLSTYCGGCNRKRAKEKYVGAYKEKIVANSKTWYENNRERSLKTKHDWYLRNVKKTRNQMLIREYGITLEIYEAMEREQNGRCSICEKPEPLHVDHNHATGKVRGLLCSACNRALGGFGDSSERLDKAANYLRSFI